MKKNSTCLVCKSKLVAKVLYTSPGHKYIGYLCPKHTILNEVVLPFTGSKLDEDDYAEQMAEGYWDILKIQSEAKVLN